MTARIVTARFVRRPAPRLRHGDDGSGVVSSLTGVVAFLAFLLLAVHLIVGLYATSIVTDAASTAARRVAGASAVDDPEATHLAEAEIRKLLGAIGDRAEVAWAIDADSVRVTVRVPRPGVVRLLGDGVIERTVTVRRELVR